MSIIKTINQERASFVLERVKEIKEKGDPKKFRSNALKLPSIIVSNGLIPSLAFLKSTSERKPVYDILNEWLKKRGYCTNDVLEELVNKDFTNLRLATMEALEFANWLKRIVEVEIKD